MLEFLNPVLESADAVRLEDETLRQIAGQRPVDDVLHLVQSQRHDDVELVEMTLLLKLQHNDENTVRFFR